MAGAHIPVLLDEAVTLLRPRPNEHFIDGTVGGGGHARVILEQTAPGGRLLAIDQDALALATAKETLAAFGERVIFAHDKFSNLKKIVDEYFPVHAISGVLLDLGVSSLELEDPDRGFSFQVDAPLDMRFDQRTGLTASDVLNSWSAERLTKKIQEYGQERLAADIVRQIIAVRQKQKITRTKQLTEAILLAYRKKLKSNREVPWIGGTHPATRTFQALRLIVNDELHELETALPQAVDILAPGGRIAVISFHSLEDRIAKTFLKTAARGCVCPPELPVCTCGHQPVLRLLTKKAVRPTPEEAERNPRSRSALLRVAQKTNTQ